MTKEQKRKWVKALLSGEYQQITGQLKDNYGYCCLGVANQVCGLGKSPHNGAIGRVDGRQWLPSKVESKLIDFNDNEGMPFELIAGFVDTYVEATE